MRYHLVFGKPLDLPQAQHDALADRAPGHVMAELADRLAAETHFPLPDSATPIDRARALLCSTPDHWALARHIASVARPDDVVYCTGEDIGIPVATACRSLRRPPKLAVFIHNIDRARTRAALQLFHCGPAITAWLTNARYQFDFIQRRLHVPVERVHWIAEQTDTHFFTPAAPRPPEKRRPIIASVGLECRDYRTLAAATVGLDVDIRISGYSKDARVLRRALPTHLPANMTCKFYPWPELRTLYRTADLVVVPVYNNKFCAGLTTFLEASACRRPTIITRTPGLAEYLPECALQVPPQNPQALRAAIVELLDHPDHARALATKAYEQVTTRHHSAAWLDAVTGILQGLASTQPALAPASPWTASALPAPITTTSYRGEIPS